MVNQAELDKLKTTRYIGAKALGIEVTYWEVAGKIVSLPRIPTLENPAPDQRRRKNSDVKLLEFSA